MHDLVAQLTPWFEPYFTLEGVDPSARYDYKARGLVGLRVFRVSMHAEKCRAGAWVYVAIDGGTSLSRLAPRDRLYVGSQQQDRMFRGDGMRGLNFHHAQMRAGNGPDTPDALLGSGSKVKVMRLDAERLRGRADAGRLARFLELPGRHAGYWIEQAILALEPGQWRWNTAPAAGAAVSRLRAAGLI